MNKPTRQQVVDEIALKSLNVDPVEWYDYHEDCDWTIRDTKGGKNARKDMVSWRGTLRTWHKISGSSTSFNAVKQRDEAYTANKAVYMKPVKKKPANPEVEKLKDQSKVLVKSLRKVAACKRPGINAEIREISRQIIAANDSDIKLGELIK
jgi:hypothetical protein